MNNELHSSKPSVCTSGVRDFFTKWIEGLERLLEERDRRYDERFRAQEEAVKAAFAAQRELNNTVATASREAITKAEAAQSDYNKRSNEFRGALDDQAKLMAQTMMPRLEADSKFKTMLEKLETLEKRYEDKLETAKALYDGKIEGTNKEIATLRDAKVQTESRTSERKEVRTENREIQLQSNWKIGIAIGIFFSSMSLIIALIMFLREMF